jgi:hypothetical protein
VKDEYLFIQCPLLNIRAPCLSGVLLPPVCVGWKSTVLLDQKAPPLERNLSCLS